MALSPPLRPLEEGDWQQVHDIVLEVATAGETYSMDVPGSVEETRAFWTGQHNEVVLDESGRVVGTSKMGPNRPAQGSHVGTASFMVGSSARGRGFGRALADHMVEWHRSHGFRGIQFNAVVATNTSALRLWRDLGFETVGLVPGAFRLPSGQYADLHVMYLDLTDSAGD